MTHNGFTWPEGFPNVPMLNKDGNKPTLVFDTSHNTHSELVTKILESEIFYLKFNILKESLRKLESRASFQTLKQIKIYLDTIYRIGDIDTPINGYSFIHFLIREYYINIDMNLSVIYEIYELIEKILKNDLIDVNLKNINGNTGLMQIYSYIKEANEKIKNGNRNLIVSNLDKLAVLLDQNGGIITLTPEQQIVEKEINIERELMLEKNEGLKASFYAKQTIVNKNTSGFYAKA